MSTRPTVLILLGAFWPGNDSSGPNLSLKAMCEALAADFDFRVVARDRPFGAASPMISPGWHDLGYAQAAYLPVGPLGAQGLGALIANTPHNVLHLNGFNDREFTIPALLQRRLIGNRAAVLMSPRGEFSHGALAIKPLQKRVWRIVAQRAALLKNMTFHVTSEAERDDLRAVLGDVATRLIHNFRPIFAVPRHVPRAATMPLRAAFLGRISPVKGTDIALRALANVERPVHFELYGPVQDAAYWRECETLIARLPTHVTVAAKGEIANASVPEMLARQDVMLLPSVSENFGHGIFEALAAGTPVIIGDRTPWRNLTERRAGFDLPRADLDALSQAIDRMAGFGAAEAARWRSGARAVAEDFVAASPALPQMRALFRELAG